MHNLAPAPDQKAFHLPRSQSYTGNINKIILSLLLSSPVANGDVSDQICTLKALLVCSPFSEKGFVLNCWKTEPSCPGPSLWCSERKWVRIGRFGFSVWEKCVWNHDKKELFHNGHKIRKNNIFLSLNCHFLFAWIVSQNAVFLNTFRQIPWFKNIQMNTILLNE